MSDAHVVHSVASGEIDVWNDDGVICLRVTNEYNDPAELAEHEALELVAVLERLVREVRGEP